MTVISPVEAVLLCPRNDEESLQILKIAAALELPTVVSSQPHGARLAKEGHLLERIRSANPSASTLVIVELPGPEVEAQLEAAGYQIIIIDHHRYEGLDRMKMQSSLEQFLTAFDLSDERLRDLGFDPMLVRGVGAIDRGFVWELKKDGYAPADAQRARDYYRALGYELGENFALAEQAARAAWDKREVQGGVIIVRSINPQIRIREAISFIIADHFEEPPTCVIIEGQDQITVQDTAHAPRLFAAFGGYLFGQNLCWGLKLDSHKKMPTLLEVMAILLE